MYEQCYEFYNRKTNAFEITSNKAYFFRIINSLVLFPVIYPRPKGYWSEDVSFLKIIWNGYVIFFIMYM